MKRIFLVMLAVAGMTVASCERSFDEGGSVATDQAATVSVNLGFPTMQTRAYSNGMTATHLQYAVFEKKGETLTKLNSYTVTDDEIHISKQIDFQLVTGRNYQFVFWAAAPSEDEWENPYKVEFTETGATMTVDYDNVMANDERCDAFFASVEKQITGDVQMSVELFRPFAQINVGTSDYEVAAEQHCEPNLSQIKLNKAYTSLDLVDGTVADTVEENATFKFNTIEPNEKFPVSGYQYLAMAYVLAAVDDAADYTVTFSYKEDGGDATERTVGSVPLNRNHRTNMFGQVLTSTASVNVIIVPEYDEPDYNYSQLLFAAAVGGTAVLDGDVTLPADERIVFTDKDAVVDLNGKTVKGCMDGLFRVDGNASLIVKGNGKMIQDKNDGEQTIAVWNNGGTVTIEDGYFEANNNGSLIYSSAGTVYVKGGTFKVTDPAGQKYTLNCYDDAAEDGSAEFVVTGGMFYNYNPAEAYSERVPRPANWVPAGYKSVKTTIDGEEWYVVVAEETVVANSAEELANAVKTKGATVQLMPGSYSFTKFADNVTIIGTEGTVCNVGGNNGMSNGVTFKGVKFVYTGGYSAFTGCSNLTYENCEFEGEPFSYAANAVYKNCTFYQTNDAYNIWAYTSSPLTFDGCTFNCAGKGLLIYNEGGQQNQQVYVKNCKFYASQPVTGKAAIEISSQFHSVDVYIENCTAEGFGLGNVSNETLWNCKNSTKPVNVYVDGELKHQKK